MSATQGEKGVLHTKSSYFNAAASYAEGGAARTEMFNNEAIASDLQRALEYAENQEMIFYNQFFPSSSYEDFMGQIRKIFAGAHRDGERIRSLANPNLSKFIPEGWNQKDTGKASIRIQEEFLPGEIDLSMFDSVNTSVNPKELYVTVTKESAPAVKKFLMKLLMEGAKDPDKYWTATPGYTKKQVDFPGVSRWSKKTDKKKALYNYMSQIIEENKSTLLEKAGVKFEVTKGKLTIEDLEKEIIPFTQYTLTSVKDALKNPETRALLERVLRQIKDFILNDCLHVKDGFVYDNGRGNILEKAAESAWASIEEEILKGLASHFLEGMNLSKGLLGAGGEFQVKLINNYLALVGGKDSLAKIIGGIIEDNRAEPRTDVQIIKELGGDMGTYIAGIQVKNVNENTQTHLSISSDLELIAPNLPEDFRDAMANSMFNTDIKSIVGDAEALLQKYVTVYFWRAMNLNVTDDLNPNHTNTFYFVGGENLVPASRIIGEMVNRQSMGISEPKFTITGFQNPSMGDADYAERHGVDRKPTFIDYWDPIRYLGFGKGSELGVNTANVSLYNSLLAGVSINTEFNISAVIASMNNMKSFTNIFSK